MHATALHTQRLKQIGLSALISITTLLSACANLQPTQHSEAALFNMEARIATDFGEQHTERNITGNIDWQERSGLIDIRLSTPFGNTLALIQLTPTQATFKGADGSVVQEANPEDLFYRLFGMDLPIANLRDWIGTPNTPLPKLRQAHGWQVLVTDTFDNPNLARRLEISRTTPEPMTLTVAILERSDQTLATPTPTHSPTPMHSSAATKSLSQTHTPPNSELDYGQIIEPIHPRTPLKPKHN